MPPVEGGLSSDEPSARLPAARAGPRARGTRAALLSLVDLEGAPLEIAPVQLRNGLGRFRGRAHLDEREPARTSRLTIGDDLDVDDGSRRSEQGPKIGLGRGEREIANKQTCAHFRFLLLCVDG